MLSYRHSFHAGNHADVLKHVVQSLIIGQLKQKEKPFLFMDTHAGAGRYLLSSKQANITQEYQQGIQTVWSQRNAAPDLLHAYLSVIKHYNGDEALTNYPGSPLIAKQLLRTNDKIHLTELHPADYALLRKNMNNDPRTMQLQADGFQQIKSQLPPISRRGFVLLDPSYEIKSDYELVVNGIMAGHKRFATGVYAIWYPVVLRQRIKRMIAALKETKIDNILQIELAVCQDNTQRGMTASGMIIINPPWALEMQMKTVLPWLYRLLAPNNTGHTLISWITPPK